MMNLTDILERIEGTNPSKGEYKDVFSYNNPPRISIGCYIDRLFTNILNEKKLLPFVIYYMSLYSHKKKYVINRYNIHKILLISVVITHKFWEDESYTNKILAKIGGISLKELNSLEVEFLKGIEWELYKAETELEEEELDEIINMLIKI